MADQTKSPARRGYQASDLRAALTDPMEGLRQSPRIEVPIDIIESMRVTGRDKLTALDHAIYYGLMALAIEAGIDAPSHTVSLRDLARYAEVDHVDRIKASLRRLSETVVTYQTDTAEIEETGWLHLITDTRLRRRKVGEPSASTITYVVPEYTRSLFLNPARYAKLEILAFPLFSCRYTARLYPRLALRAGYKPPYAGDTLTWTVDPEELAREIGYITDEDAGAFAYGQFRRNVLDPVMRDIREHVTRFQASYAVERPESTGSGRGRPVQRIVFSFTPARSLVAEAKMRPISKDERSRVMRPDEDVPATQLPSVEMIARACTHLKRGPDEISEAWRAAVLRAQQNPTEVIAGDLTGAGLLYTMDRHGTDEAFRVWADAQVPSTLLDTRRPPSQHRVAPAAPRPAADDKIAAAKRAAQDLIDLCDNVFVGPSGRMPMSVDDETISGHLYDDLSPWADLAADCMPTAIRAAYDDVRKALPMLHKLTPDVRRQSTRDLAVAIVEWTLEAIIRAARAVAQRAASPAVSPVTPPRVPSIFKRRGFVDEIKSDTLSEGL